MIRPDVPYAVDGTLKSKNYDSSGCALCGWRDDKLQELTAFQEKDLYSLTTTPRLLSRERRGADTAKRANELSYNGPRLPYSSTFVISRAAAGIPSHLRHLSSRRMHYSAYVTLLSLSYAVVRNLFTQSASPTGVLPTGEVKESQFQWTCISIPLLPSRWNCACSLCVSSNRYIHCWHNTENVLEISSTRSTARSGGMTKIVNTISPPHKRTFESVLKAMHTKSRCGAWAHE